MKYEDISVLRHFHCGGFSKSDGYRNIVVFILFFLWNENSPTRYIVESLTFVSPNYDPAIKAASPSPLHKIIALSA